MFQHAENAEYGIQFVCLFVGIRSVDNFMSTAQNTIRQILTDWLHKKKKKSKKFWDVTLKQDKIQKKNKQTLTWQLKLRMTWISNKIETTWNHYKNKDLLFFKSAQSAGVAECISAEE